METLFVAVLSGAFSFVGSWAAIKVHLFYMRRDIDHAHKRIDLLEGKPA